MRIAYLSFDAGIPIGGTRGSSVHVRHVVESLRRIGHEVRVFSVAASENGTEGDGVYRVHLDGLARALVDVVAAEDGLPEHLASEWRSLFTAERAQRTLRGQLTDFDPDVIYERYSLFGYAGVELAADLAVPFILEVNAPLCHEQATYRTLALQKTAEEMERKIFRAATAILTVSTPLAEHAIDLGVQPERVTVLANAVDADHFDPATSPEPVRSRYQLDGKRVLGFVGSLKPWHDLDTLIAATRLIVDHDDSVHLLVVGDGPGRAEGDHNITFTGAIPHDAVPGHLAAMDVVAVPYPPGGETYFSPLKLFEAMAMAKPVVGARLGQVRESVHCGESGVLYEPGDPVDLAAKVLEIMRSDDRGAAMGAAARKWVLAGHTWEHNARQIEAIASLASPMLVLP